MCVFYRDNWPPTNSLKAIDYWTGICYLLVFAALTEYCIVLYLSRRAYLGIDAHAQTGAATAATWKGAKVKKQHHRTIHTSFPILANASRLLLLLLPRRGATAPTLIMTRSCCWRPGSSRSPACSCQPRSSSPTSSSGRPWPWPTSEQ